MFKQLFFMVYMSLFSIYTQAQHETITLDDIFKKNLFRVEQINGFQSLKDGKYYVETTSEGIVKKEFITNKQIAVLVSANTVKDEKGKPLPLQDYIFNNNENKILVFKDIEHIYRHSSKALVYVYDLQTQKTTPIYDKKILHATFSPDNTQVAFVYDNNLYIKNLQNGHLKQITHDGKFNAIINGNCDWVYEEEFGFTKAFSFSENGQYIAYYKFDESKVKQYTIPFYLNNENYPKQYTYKYPKTGESNSIIEIHTYNLNSGKDIKINTGKNKDIYIPRIKWANEPHQLIVYRLNRLQNHLELLSANVTNGNVTTLYEEKNNQYIEINDNLFWIKGKQQFVITSEKNGYNNIYLYNQEGQLIKMLTNNTYDIDNVLGIDEQLQVLYFTAAYPTPKDRTLWKLNLKNGEQTLMTTTTGWHKVNFNQDFSYYVDNFSTLNTPPTIFLMNTKGDTLQVLRRNENLQKIIQSYNFQIGHFIKLPSANGVDSLEACILFPPDFKNDTHKKYPILFCNYGGPGSQTVTNKFGTFSAWHQLMAQHGYIIVSCDNRGTGFRGEAFKKCTYMQLGKLEIEDQIAAAQSLSKNPYYEIDTNRIGYWGWSYGGFMSSLAITKGADVFTAAVAIAPVTNFRYYDNIYTERYMRRPQDNPNGYDNNSPLHFVDKMKGKFLLLHGTADDNVHFQNSAIFCEAMVQHNKQFDFMSFTDKFHGISGGNTTYFLWTKVTNWLLKNL